MKIKIDLDELRLIFGNGSADVNYYLDTQTGKLFAELDELFYSDGTPAEREIVENFLTEDFTVNVRYIKIPTIEPLKKFSEIPEENYRDMQTFINNIEDEKLKNELQTIIDKKYSSEYALKQFLEVMKRKPQRQQWLLFREGQEEIRASQMSEIIDERIFVWLFSQGIELLE